MGFDPKEIKVIDNKNPNLSRVYDIADEGYYYPFSREFRKAVLEKGIKHLIWWRSNKHSKIIR